MHGMAFGGSLTLAIGQLISLWVRSKLTTVARLLDRSHCIPPNTCRFNVTYNRTCLQDLRLVDTDWPLGR